MSCFFFFFCLERQKENWLVFSLTHSLNKKNESPTCPPFQKSACVTFSVILLTQTANSCPFRQQQAFLSCTASHPHNILSSFCYYCTLSRGIPSPGRLLARLEVYSWLHINHTSVTVLTHSCTGSIPSLHPPLCSSSQCITFTNIFLLSRGMLSWGTRMFLTKFFTPENTLIQL